MARVLTFTFWDGMRHWTRYRYIWLVAAVSALAILGAGSVVGDSGYFQDPDDATLIISNATTATPIPEAASVLLPPNPEPMAGPPEIDLEFASSDAIVRALERHPADLEQAVAAGNEHLFAYGYALEQTGRHREASVALSRYHELGGRLRSYAALLLGEIHLHLQDTMGASTWFTEAAAVFVEGERHIQARFGVARALLARGENAAAARELELLIDAGSKSAWKYAIRLNLAYAYERMGQVDKPYLDKAISQLEWLWTWAPTVKEAEMAELDLARIQRRSDVMYNGPSSADRYRRAQQLLKKGNVEAGINLMLELADQPGNNKNGGGAFDFELAKAFFQARRYGEAIALFDATYQAAAASRRPEVLFWRALTTGRLAKIDDAILLYRQLAREYPSSGYAETGLHKVGLLLLDQGNFSEAEDAFRSFRKRFPKSGKDDNSLWYLAWAQLRQGEFVTASQNFDLLVKKYPHYPLAPGARYWQGRMFEVSEKNDEAIAKYRQVLSFIAPSHYALLAHNRLAALGSPIKESPASGSAPSLPDLVLPHPEVLDRVTALMSVGLRSWAQEELVAYEHTLRKRDELLSLADWYRRTGFYSGAYRIMTNLGLAGGIPGIADSDSRWQLAYPLAYLKRLETLTLPAEVPRHLVYAVMRQESEFRPWVTSPAGARGLMQVIPDTAREVCANRKQDTPPISHLYRPEVSMKLGIWHLEDLMNRLGGRLPLVIAGYNAGPEAVERWLSERPADPLDVFIEEISYSETRRYVRKVLTNFWIYGRLYGEVPTLTEENPSLEAAIVAGSKRGGKVTPASADLLEPMLDSAEPAE